MAWAIMCAGGAAAAEESGDAPAADAEAGEPERTGADDVEDNEGADDDENGEETAESPETFTPSEDISEDIAVPFPVDI